MGKCPYHDDETGICDVSGVACELAVICTGETIYFDKADYDVDKEA